MRVHGSGLTLALWLPPHASVLELLPRASAHSATYQGDAYEPSWGMLAYASGHTYRIVPAVLIDRPETHLHVEVDVPAIRKADSEIVMVDMCFIVDRPCVNHAEKAISLVPSEVGGSEPNLRLHCI